MPRAVPPRLDDLRAMLATFRRLRAAHDREAAGVRRRQPAGAGDVRRRGARPRGGPRGPAVRRPLRQAARPDDEGDRPRPHRRLYRQHHSVAPARQPHADPAGKPDLPAVHPAPDRACQPRHPGLPRRAVGADAARREGRHQAHARPLVHTSTPARARSRRLQPSIRPICCARRWRSASPGATFWPSKKRSTQPDGLLLHPSLHYLL